MTSGKLYYKIGEVARMLGVNTSTLRFWEKEFPQIKPKRKHGERFYTPEDVETFKLIRFLLHEEKYTIEGARKKLQAERKKIVSRRELLEELIDLKEALLDLKKRL